MGIRRPGRLYIVIGYDLPMVGVDSSGATTACAGTQHQGYGQTREQGISWDFHDITGY